MSDDVIQSFASPEGEARARVKHPFASFFHVFFRASALLVYILITNLISDHFIELFLTVVLLLAFDFWTVKNVTGRLMVGLRWWNKVDEDGTSSWQFESKKKTNTSGPESVIFWGALFACPLLWILCLFTAIIKFNWEWAIIPIVGIALNGANVVGYVKCRRDAGAKLTQMAGQFIGKQIMKETVKQTLGSQLAGDT